MLIFVQHKLLSPIYINLIAQSQRIVDPIIIFIIILQMGILRQRS